MLPSSGWLPLPSAFEVASHTSSRELDVWGGWTRVLIPTPQACVASVCSTSLCHTYKWSLPHHSSNVPEVLTVPFLWISFHLSVFWLQEDSVFMLAGKVSPASPTRSAPSSQNYCCPVETVKADNSAVHSSYTLWIFKGNRSLIISLPQKLCCGTPAGMIQRNVRKYRPSSALHKRRCDLTLQYDA